MGRAPCCDKANVKKGPWSPEEDMKLKEFIEKYGTGGNWIALPQKAGLKRCGKSCRLRWLNYLRPNIKHGEFSDEEDRVIFSLYASIGSRWSIIASHLPGRTDNDIKNYWNTKLKKKLLGIAPTQMKPNQQEQLLQLHQNLLFSSSFSPPSSSSPLVPMKITSSDLLPAHESEHPSTVSNITHLISQHDQYSQIMNIAGNDRHNMIMFGSSSNQQISCNQQMISYFCGGTAARSGEQLPGLGDYYYGGGDQLAGATTMALGCATVENIAPPRYNHEDQIKFTSCDNIQDANLYYVSIANVGLREDQSPVMIRSQGRVNMYDQYN